MPEGWKVIKDRSAACQIGVPAEWVPFGENNGAAVLHDSGMAIAVVTSQPGQQFRTLSPGLVKTMGLAREKMFENSAKRIFYQDKSSRGPDDANAYSSSVPAKSGTCSCHIVILPSVPEEVVKKIALTLAPVGDPM
ncbi:MAG: hypothetical protein LAQ30_08050 [Acidobacteriia bacterium]|nr:hypothetical protein [Terriglobia bacterium]